MPKWYFWGTAESDVEREVREAGYKHAPGRRDADRPYIPTLDHRTLTALKVALAHNIKPGWPGEKYARLSGSNIYKTIESNGLYSAEIKNLLRELYGDRSIVFGEITYDNASDFRTFRKKNPRIIGDIQDSNAECACNSCDNCRNPGVIRDGKFINPVCEACSDIRAAHNGKTICSRAACDHDFRIVETVRRRAEIFEVKSCRKCSLKEETPVFVPISDRGFLNTYEAAKALGVGHCRVRQLLRQNRFSGAIKTSRDWIIPFDSVDAMRIEIGPDAIRKRVGGRGHSFSDHPVSQASAEASASGLSPYGMPIEVLDAMIEENRASSEEDVKPSKRKIDGRTYEGRAMKLAEEFAVDSKPNSLDVKKVATKSKKRPSKPESKKSSSRSA